MRLVLSWLRDFVDIKASAEEIAEKLGLRGFEVASVERLPKHETHPELPDGVIDFEVTANRPDCLSIMGLAREVATAFDVPFAPTNVTQGASVLPNSDALSAAVPGVPVALARSDGHALWVNRAALARANLDPGTPGVLLERAAEAVLTLVPA